MRQLNQHWQKDLDTGKLCRIHIAVVMVSSEYGVEKESCLFLNSKLLEEFFVIRISSEKILLSEAHRHTFAHTIVAKTRLTKMSRSDLRQFCMGHCRREK